MLLAKITKKMEIGITHYQALEKYAASVSAHCGCTVTADHFIHYLIEDYAESACDTIIAALKN